VEIAKSVAACSGVQVATDFTEVTRNLGGCSALIKE
jgi:hypothetical protein